MKYSVIDYVVSRFNSFRVSIYLGKYKQSSLPSPSLVIAFISLESWLSFDVVDVRPVATSFCEPQRHGLCPVYALFLFYPPPPPVTWRPEYCMK